MRKWMETLAHYFKMCEIHDNKSNRDTNAYNKNHVKKIYGIDKDKKIIEIKGFNEVFIETSDDEGLLIDLESRNIQNQTAISIRSWPSYQSVNNEPNIFSRVVIKPCAANLIEINVDR